MSSVVKAQKGQATHTEGAPAGLALRQQVIVLAGAMLGIAGGVTMFLGTLGIFLKPIALSFNWSRADVSLIPVMFLAGLAFGAQLIGHIAERIGWNRVIAASIVLTSLGILAMMGTPASQAYVVGLAFLIGVVGVATGPAGYLSTIASVFDHRLGMALGLVIFGSALGVAAAPLIANALLGFMEWRGAYGIFAAITLLVGFAGHQMVFRVLANRASGSTKTRGPEQSPPSGDGISFRETVRTFRFWLIVIVASITTSFYAGVVVHLPSYATDQGLSGTQAAQAAGTLGITVAVARLGGGILLDRVFAPLLTLCVFLIGAMGYFLLGGDIAHESWRLPFAAILIGMAGGAEGDILPFLVRKYFGTRSFGTIYGVIYSFAVLASAVSAYLYGWTYDLFGSYIPTFQIAAALFCVCGFAILTLGRYQYGFASKS